MTTSLRRTDPVQAIPDPETVRAQLAEAIRRRDLLRSLLRVAQKKASYDRPSPTDTSEDTATTPADGGKEVAGG